MRKITCFLVLFILCVIKLKGQCSDKDFFFNLKPGISKFESFKILKNQSGVVDITSDLNYWEKEKNGDSAMYGGANYKFLNHPCINGQEYYVHLQFKNDKLWCWWIRIIFSANDFLTCTNNYNRIASSMKESFPMSSKIASISDNEQTGEGLYFYKSAKSEDYYSLEYGINYEEKFDNNSLKYKKAGKIKGYDIQLMYMNMKINPPK